MDIDDYDQDVDAGEENEYETSRQDVPRKRKRYEVSDDEDEDDDDEEEEEDGRNGGRKQKRRKKTFNPFIDAEAIVEEDDDDDEEDEEEEGFVEHHNIEEDEEEGTMADRALAHQRFARAQNAEMNADEIVQQLKERYGGRSTARLRDLQQVPQRLLVPSVSDPNLWQIKVKIGRERDIVYSLLKKAIAMEFKAQPLRIISAFERSTLPGLVYVESRSKEAVVHATNGLIGVFKRDPVLVPIDEMAPLLQLKKKDIKVTQGMWVRIRKGRYQGDLAQVIDVVEGGEEVGVRFIPRIDLTPREADSFGADGKIKRKRTIAGNNINSRPPARFFNPEEVLRIYGKKAATKRGRQWVFQGDTYEDGFIEKDLRIALLQLEAVNPTLEELSRFASQGEEGEKALTGTLDLTMLADAAKRQAVSVLQPGDNVEVFQGEQTGAQGVVESILGDVVTIRGTGMELDSQMIEVPAVTVRKRFMVGDHVKVMSGQNVDDTGLVISVVGDKVTFLSDLKTEEVTVFAKDLRTAAEVGSGSNVVGSYELHDLVQLDQQTVGVIYRVERNMFHVIDQNGQTRLVMPHQITMRRDTRRVVSTDHNGHELRIGDNVKEVEGEMRRGEVIHIHQGYTAFLRNRDVTQNGGIFVTRCRSLEPIAPKGGIKATAPDLTKMNPALASAQGGAPSMTRGPRDRLVGVLVVVVKGPNKGFIGTIKDVNGEHCRVEVHTQNKIITIEKDKLRRKTADGKIEPLDQFGPKGFLHPGAVGRGGQQGNRGQTQSLRTPNPHNSDGGRTPGWGTDGGRTPGWGSSGRTPNPYNNDSSRTPAWSATSQTPNPYNNDGSRTSAWSAHSRTPNPYSTADGSRTPGPWGSSARTPNPHVNSGRTPSWENGGRTPNPYNKSDDAWGATPAGAGATGKQTPSWGRSTGSATPGWGKQPDESSQNDGWGTPVRNNNSNSDAWNAPTPYSAPTPYATAPTPYLSAPTPYASAPTPGVSGPTPGPNDPYSTAETPRETPRGFAETPYVAATPGIAPTPGVGAFGAPTPFVGETPGPGHLDFGRQANVPFVITDDWLSKFNIPGLHITFRADASWYNGMYNERTVRLVSIMDGREKIQRTATVQFLDGDDKDESIGGVPIDVFEPHHPRNGTYENLRVALLQRSTRHGSNVGEIVRLRDFSNADKEWTCVRDNGAEFEMPLTGLCVWSEVSHTD